MVNKVQEVASMESPRNLLRDGRYSRFKDVRFVHLFMKSMPSLTNSLGRSAISWKESDIAGERLDNSRVRYSIDKTLVVRSLVEVGVSGSLRAGI